MRRWESRWTGLVILSLILLYCVYVVSTVNIKNLSDEGIVNIAAYYVGFLITLPASIVASFLPEDSGELDRIVYVILSIVSVIVFVIYLGKLLTDGKCRQKRQ